MEQTNGPNHLVISCVLKNVHTQICKNQNIARVNIIE